MSRGLGRVERAVLLELSAARQRPDVVELANSAYGLNWRAPTRAQLEAVRRAVRSLRRKGLLPKPPRPSGYGRVAIRLRLEAEAVEAQVRRFNDELDAYATVAHLDPDVTTDGD